MHGTEVTDQVLAELGYEPRSKLKKTVFVKGPLPLGWLLRVDVASGTVLAALIIKMLVDLRGEPVHLSSRLASQFNMSRNKRKRVLDALERAGIIRTERPHGQVVRIWLIDKP
jgi:hypothetical protein